jgi:hypothetical protein
MSRDAKRTFRKAQACRITDLKSEINVRRFENHVAYHHFKVRDTPDRALLVRKRQARLSPPTQQQHDIAYAGWSIFKRPGQASFGLPKAYLLLPRYVISLRPIGTTSRRQRKVRIV